MHVLAAYFSIPYGAVWSNLLASGMCFSLAHWRMRKHVTKHMDSVHEKLDGIRDGEQR